ncbi:hypothetical protein J3E68DRAFT_329058 [Trichoderma sp. SZMC 28012]
MVCGPKVLLTQGENGFSIKTPPPFPPHVPTLILRSITGPHPSLESSTVFPSSHSSNLSCWTPSPSHGGLSMEVSVIEMTNQSIFITPNLTELRTQVNPGGSVLKQRRYNTHEVQMRNPQVANQACRELVETRGRCLNPWDKAFVICSGPFREHEMEVDRAWILPKGALRRTKSKRILATMLHAC